jgi:heme-degrading monooxygenase HmoA
VPSTNGSQYEPTSDEEKAMSVFMTLEAAGDPKALEKYAADNKQKMQAILEAAKRHGLIAHRFRGSDDGSKLMVVDEWPDRQSFEAFFQEQQSEIQPLMEAAGVTAQIEPTFWRELSTHDAHGWGA